MLHKGHMYRVLLFLSFDPFNHAFEGDLYTREGLETEYEMGIFRLWIPSHGNIICAQDVLTNEHVQNLNTSQKKKHTGRYLTLYVHRTLLESLDNF